MANQIYILSFGGAGATKMGSKDISDKIAKDLFLESGLLPAQTYVHIQKAPKRIVKLILEKGMEEDES